MANANYFASCHALNTFFSNNSIVNMINPEITIIIVFLHLFPSCLGIYTKWILPVIFKWIEPLENRIIFDSLITKKIKYLVRLKIDNIIYTSGTFNDFFFETILNTSTARFETQTVIHAKLTISEGIFATAIQIMFHKNIR